MTAGLGARALLVIAIGVSSGDGGAGGSREGTASGRGGRSAASRGSGSGRVGTAGRAAGRATSRARAEQGRAGDIVLGQSSVGVEEDTRVGGGVQLGTQGALGAFSA